MKTQNFLMLVVAFLLSLNTITTAQPRREYLNDKLNLTQKQIDDIQKLRDEHFKVMSDYRNELQKLAIDLRAEWRKTNPDRKNIEKLMSKMNDIRAKMNQQRIDHWFNIYNLLDEKQKETFKKYRAEFWGERRFRKPGFGRGLFYGRPPMGKGWGPCGAGFGPWWDKD